MTAEGAAIQHQHRETFGSRVDGGGKTRRPGADDDHVINLVRVDRPDEADAPREFDVAGIAQQLSVGTDDDRQVALVDMEAVDQRLRARIGFWVEPLVRMPVAREKAFEAQNIAVVGAADDHRSAGTGVEKINTAQDQGAHDALAQLGLFHHQVAQPARRDDERLDRFLGVGIDQRGAAGQLRKLAHERARTVRHDKLGISQPSVLHDIDAARENDEGAGRYLSGRNDMIARRIGFALPEPQQPIDLRRLEHGEHLVVPGGDQRLDGLRHFFLSGGLPVLYPKEVQTLEELSVVPAKAGTQLTRGRPWARRFRGGDGEVRPHVRLSPRRRVSQYTGDDG